jgi:hypothetical protein
MRSMGHAIHCLKGGTFRVRQQGLQHRLWVRHLCQRAEQSKQSRQSGIIPHQEPGLVCEEPYVKATFVASRTLSRTVVRLDLGQFPALGFDLLFQPLLSERGTFSTGHNATRLPCRYR